MPLYRKKINQSYLLIDFIFFSICKCLFHSFFPYIYTGPLPGWTFLAHVWTTLAVLLQVFLNHLSFYHLFILICHNMVSPPRHISIILLLWWKTFSDFLFAAASGHKILLLFYDSLYSFPILAWQHYSFIHLLII